MHLTRGTRSRDQILISARRPNGRTAGQHIIINCFLKMPDQTLFVFKSRVSWLAQSDNAICYFHFCHSFLFHFFAQFAFRTSKSGSRTGAEIREKKFRVLLGLLHSATNCEMFLSILPFSGQNYHFLFVLKYPTIIVFALQTQSIKENKTQMKTMKTIRFRHSVFGQIFLQS